MKIWLDAHFSPTLATWMRARFHIEAVSVLRLNMADARDRMLFLAARAEGAAFMTKDHDFVTLLNMLGPPPPVIWITCGNCDSESLRRILDVRLESAMALIEQGEQLVEISSRWN